LQDAINGGSSSNEEDHRHPRPPNARRESQGAENELPPRNAAILGAFVLVDISKREDKTLAKIKKSNLKTVELRF
jgi:hypothetical protein